MGGGKGYRVRVFSRVGVGKRDARCIILSWTGRPRAESRNAAESAEDSVVGELLHPVGALEKVGHRLVHTGDDLVDGLLPRLLLVLAGDQRFVEFPQSRFNDNSEVFRNLQGEGTVCQEHSVGSKGNRVLNSKTVMYHEIALFL